MKKYAWIIVVIALAIWIIPFCSSAENLIQNGGFEYDLVGWYPIDYLGNSITTRDNASTSVAIEGKKNLSVDIVNANPAETWKTSVKYPIPVIVYPGDYAFSFTVTRLSQDAEISGGVMDDTPPWKSYQWTGPIDLSNVPVGVPVTMSFPVTIPYEAWNLAIVLNLAGTSQNIILDNVRFELKSEIILVAQTKISGSVINATAYSFSKLYVMLYPEGDAFWNDANAVIVSVPGSLSRGKTATWSAVVPSGSKYNIEIYSQSGSVYKRITRPWAWNVNAANVSEVSGIDFQIVCSTYKSSTSWLKLGDACYK